MAPASPYIESHTSRQVRKLCGSAPYSALTQIDAMEGGCCGGLVELVELVGVGA